MKIDFNTVDQEQFTIKENLLNGNIVYLIQPKHIGIKFTQENKIFRSSVWDKEGNLISAGFPKFTNFLENTENFPVPSSLKGCTAVEKIDGSALIVSRWKGNTIIRTRGTVDASQLETGAEIELLQKKYPDVFDFDGMDDLNHSFIYEWVSPANRIVLEYTEPDIYLIGVINHDDYSLMPQNTLDEAAVGYRVKRPETHTFSSIDDILQTVKLWKGKEGICLYSNGGQTIHKIKADEYLVLHQFKENATLENTIDLFVEYNYPTYTEFQSELLKKFDYECWNMIRGFASKVCDGYKQVLNIITGMQGFLVKVKALPTRREQAELILKSYGNTNRAGFVFTLLDGKPLSKDQTKKLLYQCLK